MTTKNTNGPVSTFSEKTTQLLLSAGWMPNRKVALDRYRAAFAEEGLGLSPKVETFLRRFGGLVINYKTKTDQDDTLDFLADEAVEGLGGKALSSYARVIQSHGLSPIGDYAF